MHGLLCNSPALVRAFAGARHSMRSAAEVGASLGDLENFMLTFIASVVVVSILCATALLVFAQALEDLRRD
jgi:hypothetical protein